MKKMRTIKLVIVLSIGMFVVISCKKEDSCTEQTWYQDLDGDGFGDPNNSQLSCDPPAGFISNNGDSDDTNASVNPDAEEVCDDGIDNNGNGEIDECLIAEITGNWTDNFGSTFAISNTTITETTNNYVWHILDEVEDYAICLNDSDNPFNADLYSKFVFTDITEDEFYYCQSYYDGSSQIFIENADDISDSDNLTSGCSGFAWSLMTRD